MKKEQLITEIRRKKSFLCVGLDTDPNKIPGHLKSKPDGLLEFNKGIIDATKEYAVAFKPNIAFYESLGTAGWDLLEATLDYIPNNIFTIADAKRGDIANTASMYARTFFERYPFHAVTVAPYMGEDSVRPFLEFENKWAIVLGLTSNAGASDFQLNELSNGGQVFEKVIERVASWGNDENTMFVVGATKAESFESIRKIVPNHFFLVPGVGAQGGSLEEVSKYGLNKDVGLLVNSSRGIIYASSGTDYAEAAAKAAAEIQQKMQVLLEPLD